MQHIGRMGKLEVKLIAMESTIEQYYSIVQRTKQKVHALNKEQLQLNNYQIALRKGISRWGPFVNTFGQGL